MRVLLQNRSDSNAKPGGDEVVLRQLSTHLGPWGIEATVSTELRPDLAGLDLVHLFGIVRIEDTYIQWEHAAHHNLPVVTSPMYPPRERLIQFEKRGWARHRRWLARAVPGFDRRQALKTLVRGLPSVNLAPWLKQASLGYSNQQRTVLRGSARLFVDTDLEAKTLEREFNISSGSMARIPLSPDLGPQDAMTEAMSRSLPPRGFVLCPARIEPLKNQHLLMDTLRDADLDLVFCGPLNPWHRGYTDRFRAEVLAHPRWHYLGFVARRHLGALYDAAGVVVVPSWMENCCLAAIEGAARRVPVVVTRESFTREYLGDRATYCDPRSVSSLRAAIFDALARAPRSERPIGTRSWTEYARQVADEYRACAEDAGAVRGIADRPRCVLPFTKRG